MNRKYFALFAVTAAAAALLFSSCNIFSSIEDEDLVGIWVDDSEYALAMELSEDGTARMAGTEVDFAGREASFSWNNDGYHLEINALLNYYSGYYAYDLSTDGDTLTLYFIAEGLMNWEYDSIAVGDVYVLSKQSEDTSFEDIIDDIDAYDSSLY
ncbi:MAG: hypothetical protein PQJ61_05000 [Spirochaetales bacterium]|uniref:Lipocalin-like domain-containing protein n=1 Tax=Candidatus Thalassospirochaeta sargassi TaxID=3119039 RepID=A0AAJ1IBA3_9SPIO|nr:hypothetical protein [Spirochaetales bacterium]